MLRGALKASLVKHPLAFDFIVMIHDVNVCSYVLCQCDIYLSIDRSIDLSIYLCKCTYIYLYTYMWCMDANHGINHCCNRLQHSAIVQ